MNIAYIKQISFAAIFGGVIFVGYNESEDSVVNYKRGLLAAAFILVCQGVVDQYTGPFVKKFPRFWRAVARYTLIYLVILIFFLYQKAADARGLLKHLYPELGVPVVKGMHTYDDDCDITWANFKDNLDHYYLMHLVGWFVAALMVRDSYILHFWSLLDEILELSWQHILPHFRECWWDHVIVDVLLSNTPAIFLGMLVVRKSGLKEYDWLGRQGKSSIKEWDVFRNHRRFGCLIALVMILMSNFLSGFFLINSLWIPPKNAINVYRLTVWFLLGSIAIGELHDDVYTWGTPQRLTNPISGEHRWICIGVATLEGVISYKFRHDTGNIQDVPTPWYIWVPWVIATVTIVGFYLKLRLDPKRTTKGGDSPWEIEERRKKSTRLAEKEKKQKVKAEAENSAQPVQAAEAKNNGDNGGKTKNVKEDAPKKQNKVEAAPVKPAEPVGKKNKKEAEDDSEWKVTGKGNKQEQKSQKQQQKQEKREEEEEEEEPVKVEERAAPVENEWKEIKGPKTVKKANKKKRE